MTPEMQVFLSFIFICILIAAGVGFTAWLIRTKL